MIAGVETGGTKVVAAVAHDASPGDLLDHVELPTTTPAETGAALRAFLDRWDPSRTARVGVASFGPLDLDQASAGYGSITATVKPGWPGVRIADLVGGRPFSLVSDVTGAVIGEATHGAGAGLSDVSYLTVGTGIGVGAIVDGRRVAQRSHPEVGHLPVRRHPDDAFDGVCPFHGDCIEGLASGPAIASRWGRPTRDLGPDLDRAVRLEAWYLGQLVASITYTLVPRRVILGGGVMKLPGVLDTTRAAFARELAGALGDRHPAADPSTFLVPPTLGDLAGVRGALELATQAEESAASEASEASAA
ncbi:ROK family protein [Agromyces intestinalis]|uniref:fructokinase n=1 Tax=Agromyces intestinalis TaxID=2592652 RepID=A0A5C1YKP9_9MICO|nr:ROK family protein [Agromyces intestinalis]QEO16148.1 ROK family protein [Agromyces intestinalis]